MTALRARIEARSPGNVNSRCDTSVWALGVEVHEPDGLLVGAASRARDSGDGDRDVGSEPLPCAARHRLRHLGGHGSVRREKLRRHAERGLLHLVRVRDDARRRTRRSPPEWT